ncbi:MurR/RpiR family transcriptional regulator [Tateyamaria sp.]|uniref:MurR/RpiR family transcriptional regulator n=1 Tax=Tateyamaria sp. TaxID=1929288 RepID=UPI00329B019A
MKKTDSQSTKANPRLPDAPAASIEELRTLLIGITKGTSPISLGKKSRDAFGRILDIQDSTRLLSITTLSEEINTNPSTITRLAKNLGYQGFGEFQKALLATRLQQPGTFYLNQAKSALSNANQPSKQQAVRLCHENQANIDHFIDNFDTESFEASVKLIAEAPRVLIYGIRQFHSLAAFLTYGLRLIRSDVSILDANGLGAAEEIGGLNEGDLCLVASVAPYSTQVVHVAEVAHKQGLTVVAITDLASSPLVKQAKASIFAPHQSSFISNSITSFFAVAECLINAVAASSSTQTEESLVKRQEVIKQLKVEGQQ